MKKILAPVVCAALFSGVASAGVAAAAVPRSPAVTANAHTTHRLGKWLVAHRQQIRRAVVAISSQTIGISGQQLVSELRSGKSISAVAGEHGVSTQAVVAALQRAADAEVSKAVTNHRLTTAQAAKIETRIGQFVVKLVNHNVGQKAARTPAHTATT
ncbi:MAG TPA: hypothetical protein VN816_00830 [Acidimicrobiales bacterium]|nr:hypothetical protein [Acidimicrobiales bacterium]